MTHLVHHKAPFTSEHNGRFTKVSLMTSKSHLILCLQGLATAAKITEKKNKEVCEM
jgi:hypothetical protein